MLEGIADVISFAEADQHAGADQRGQLSRQVARLKRRALVSQNRLQQGQRKLASDRAADLGDLFGVA